MEPGPHAISELMEGDEQDSPTCNSCGHWEGWHHHMDECRFEDCGCERFV